MASTMASSWVATPKKTPVRLVAKVGIGCEALRVNGIEELVVDLCRGAGLRRARDTLAQRVEADGDALAVDAAAGGECVLYRHAGDEAARELAAYRRPLREGTQLLIL